MEGKHLCFPEKKNKYEFRESIQEQMTLSGRTSENRLYLTSSNEWNCSQTEKAYLWFQKNLRGVIATGTTNEITIDAIRRGGEEKQRILKEMLLADLGICNVELSGTIENPIVSTVHQWWITVEFRNNILYCLDKNLLVRSVSSQELVCGWNYRLWSCISSG